MTFPKKLARSAGGLAVMAIVLGLFVGPLCLVAMSTSDKHVIAVIPAGFGLTK